MAGWLTSTHDQFFFDLDGTNFIASLDGLEDKLMMEVEKSMHNAGEIIAREARHNLDRNKSVVTGNLKASINVQVNGFGDHVDVLIGTNVVYAKRVEYGFYDMTDSLGRHFMQVARPYLRPAFDHKKDDALKYIAVRVRDSVDKSTGGRGDISLYE